MALRLLERLTILILYCAALICVLASKRDDMGICAGLDRLANRQKLFRRLVLIWACALITVVVLRVTAVEALPHVSTPVASIVVGVIGILATVIAFYQWHRQADEKGA